MTTMDRVYGRAFRWIGSAAVLALMLGAGEARAQACGDIDDQPEEVFDEFVDNLGIFFGGENEEMCEKIVKAAVAACHKAVSESAACQSSLVGSVLKGSKAACATSKGQSACNDEFKDGAAGAKNAIEAEADDTHEVCDAGFADELFEACMLGFPA